KRKHSKPSKQARTARRGGARQKIGIGQDQINPRHEEDIMRRTFARGDLMISSTFTLLHDALHSSSGWQGARPPPLARAKIDQLYKSKPDGEALHPWLSNFFPIPYLERANPADERGTFVVDKNNHVFLYRSFRAMWMQDRIAEIEEAQAVLVGNDLNSPSIRAAYAGGIRGPHMAIIIGHQRQSSKAPYLTAWHREHQERVDKFMGLPIVKNIIDFVSSVMRAVWPGIAASFDRDAAFHLARYGIKPMFGYFWNLCWNVAFPGQLRIQTNPHADFKNQVYICMILTYILLCVNFDHRNRSWIVLWEAEIAVQLAPWTLAGYPSALFYHFNVDVHRLRVVWTAADVDKPTPENSFEAAPGDAMGRGSLVFFNQSTMRHGPATGFDTLKMAIEAGHSGRTDYGTDLQAAFQR
ncbi:hypothetical protein B0H15DRAFT_752671, partial [Mycena belliarum]